MKPRSATALPLVPLLLVGCLLGIGPLRGAAVAEDAAPPPREAVVPVKVVAGKLVIACDISTAARRIPVNLFVELDAKSGLRLHNRAAGGIRAENRDGTTNPITIHLPDMPITVAKREHGPEKSYEDFTRFHSPNLGEVALVGSIGSQVLKDYHVVFDLHDGLMRLRAPAAQRDDAADEVEGSITTPLTLTNDLAWFTVQFADGKSGAMALGTSQFDTLIDRQAADRRGKPAGDVGALSVGDLDLAAFVALRPEDIAQVHKDGVVGLTGLNLLQHFRVEIDRVNRFARFTERKPAAFPTADLAFFRARAEEDGDAVEAFLKAHPKSRLAVEAARLLVEQRLDEDADAETTGRALRWVSDTHGEDLRATAMLGLMRMLAEAGRPKLVVAAGKIGVESGRKDRYPDSVAKIHRDMGRVLLESGAGREAWKHLLSAAFGMPEDGLVNLYLGRFYEQGGRVRRAFSRYVQASIVPESGPQALEGLERLAGKMPGEEPFSVDLVERLIGGKVLNFGAATKFEPTPKNSSNRVVLLEFFTNAHLEAALGGALGNEGILSHFPRKHLAALAYHLPTPEMEPLVNALAMDTAPRRGVRPDRPALHVIDGVLQGPGAARSDQKELVYNRLRRSVLERLATPATYSLSMAVRFDGDTLDGALVVQGPAQEGLHVHLVLAEKGVLFPGKSKVVIHRMVARASLLGGALGKALDADAVKHEIPFRASLQEIVKANEAYLDRLAAEGKGSARRLSTRIDPEQVTLVAYVRDATGAVLQAMQLDPEVLE
ncbi:MAG: hypothetical protein P1V36_01425 [Planctomycetota bacterium]|nr:hypothetical protein [Planctomycetota bacterium]